MILPMACLQLLTSSYGGTRRSPAEFSRGPQLSGCSLNWWNTIFSLCFVTVSYFLWPSFSSGPMQPHSLTSELIYPLHCSLSIESDFHAINSMLVVLCLQGSTSHPRGENSWRFSCEHRSLIEVWAHPGLCCTERRCIRPRSQEVPCCMLKCL